MMGSWFTSIFLRFKTEVLIESAKVKQWRTLDLSHLSLDKIPPSLYYPEEPPNSLCNLRCLNLDDNNIKQLPIEFSSFASSPSCHLQYLSIANNRLGKLSPSSYSFSFTHLKFLNISKNDLSISGIPPALCENCRYLEILWANDVGICELPPEIGQLTKLKTLGLRNNKIASLPPSFSQLSSLVWLTLDGNRMKEVPPPIFGLKSLRHLNLSRNSIVRLPPRWFSLKSLKLLYLRENLLVISDNLIRDLQSAPSLKRANLSGNPSTSPQPFMGCITHRTPTRNMAVETLWRTPGMDDLDNDKEEDTYTDALNKLKVHHNSSPSSSSTQLFPHDCEGELKCKPESESESRSKVKGQLPAEENSSCHLYIELQDVGTSISRGIPLPLPKGEKDEKDLGQEVKGQEADETGDDRLPDDPITQRHLPVQTTLKGWTWSCSEGGSEPHVSSRRWEIRSQVMERSSPNPNPNFRPRSRSGGESQDDADENVNVNEGDKGRLSSTSHEELPYLGSLPRPGTGSKEDPEFLDDDNYEAGQSSELRDRNSPVFLQEFRVGPTGSSVLEWGINDDDDDDDADADAGNENDNEADDSISAFQDDNQNHNNSNSSSEDEEEESVSTDELFSHYTSSLPNYPGSRAHYPGRNFDEQGEEDDNDDDEDDDLINVPPLDMDHLDINLDVKDGLALAKILSSG